MQFLSVLRMVRLSLSNVNVFSLGLQVAPQFGELDRNASGMMRGYAQQGLSHQCLLSNDL
jgi:hypothetical protein